MTKGQIIRIDVKSKKNTREPNNSNAKVAYTSIMTILDAGDRSYEATDKRLGPADLFGGIGALVESITEYAMIDDLIISPATFLNINFINGLSFTGNWASALDILEKKKN